MKVIAACHDAGGAEIVSAWLRREGVDFSAVLDGPAEAIFHRKFGEVETARGFAGADLVLCGSSAQNSLEMLCWRMAEIDGIRNAVFLDHWKNYAARFRLDNGSLSLPNEVWVTDPLAAALARRELPGATVVVEGNPYAAEVVADVRAREKERHWGTRILYVAEPGRPIPRVSDLRRIEPEEYEYRARSHPAEAFLGQERTLADDLAWADIVVGYDSMALAVALQLELRVVTLLPPDEEQSIPWMGLERLHPLNRDALS